MRIEVLTDRPEEHFVAGLRLYPEGSSAALTIEEARPANPGWVLSFAEVRSREAADPYRLAYLEVEADAANVLPADAFFWHEMIGVTVRDPGGADLGTVRAVYRAGAADVLEVTGGARGDFDLPLARPFVRVLAPRDGVIVVDPDALDLPVTVPPPPPPRPPRPRRATRRRPAVPAPGPREAAPPAEPGDVVSGRSADPPLDPPPGPNPGPRTGPGPDPPER